MNDERSMALAFVSSSTESIGNATTPTATIASSDSSTSGRIVSEREPNGNSRFRFENRAGLVSDLAFLANMPEVADVTFLVGDEKQPVCGVRAILAARSRVFRKMLFPERDPLGAAAPLEKKASRKFTSQIDGNVSSSSSSSSSSSTTNPSLSPPGKCYVIPDFEHLEFKQLIHFLHTGTCTLQAQILPGLMNAADHFGVDELKKACMGFVDSCIGTDTVCPLLNIAERYIQYKSTKSLVHKVLDYIDRHGDEVLALPSFATLPGHVVSLILSRDELKASEWAKFAAARAWAVACNKRDSSVSVKSAIEPLVSCIAYHRIAPAKLMKEIKPLGFVPDETIMMALAYHADPASVDMDRESPRAKIRSPTPRDALASESSV